MNVSELIARMNYGECPTCRTVKFIGHGPLCSDCYSDPRPCRGRNANVCVAEGCYGEACVTTNRPPETDEEKADG
jgi:hypothetical protein